MSQHDFSIANQTASSARTDINNALQALVSCNSGSSAPSTTYANMFWYETDTNILKMRNEADSAWISLFYLDQSNNKIHILDDTEVANTSGTKIGVLGDHSNSTWTTGTNTEKRLVSPAQVKSAIETLTTDGIGVGQTWQNVLSSRSSGTSYQNTTGQPIMVAASQNSVSGTSTIVGYVSTDNSSFVEVGYGSGRYGADGISFIVPDDHYYKVDASLRAWSELR